MGFFSDFIEEMKNPRPYGSSPGDPRLKNPNDINIQIAILCYKSLGYCTDVESIGNTILHLAAQQAISMTGENTKIKLTEKFFYEEAAFYFMTVHECQQSYGLIDSAIKAASQDGWTARKIKYEKILKCLKEYSVIIASDRIAYSLIKDTITEQEAGLLIDARQAEYKDSQLNQMSCDEPIHRNTYTAGLSPRTHPLNIYLGKIADNIIASTTIAEDDGFTVSLVEIALLATYTEALHRAATLSASNA